MADSMRYLPNTLENQNEMLKTIGVSSIEELFSGIPQNYRMKKNIDLPQGLHEREVVRIISGLQAQIPELSLIGAGCYPHYIPAFVDQLLLRSEFYTAYTPYQPEYSQGTLKTMFEYQSIVCELLNMEVANSSLYDCGSALAEAVLMASRVIKGRNKILFAHSVNPEYMQIAQTYTDNGDFHYQSIQWQNDGTMNIETLKKNLSDDTLAVIVSSPNFLGNIEPLSDFAKEVKNNGSFFIVVVPEILSVGLIEPPGSYHADVVVSEGMNLSLGASLGGPTLGIFTSRNEYIRQIPGRIVGRTVDKEGKEGFVATLSTREQHIRREKATSNICTNQQLVATGFTMHLCALGPTGFENLAQENHALALWLKKELVKLGYTIPYSAPTFNEFVIEVPSSIDIKKLQQVLLQKKIVFGLPLSNFYPDIPSAKKQILVSVTEACSQTQSAQQGLEWLVSELKTFQSKH